MRCIRLWHGLRLAPAIVLVLVLDAARWAGRLVASGLAWLARAGRFPWLECRVARLSPAVALPCFLVPEICSRLGWVASAWLLMQGRARMAVLVYAGSKLIAGLAALWIYRACRPALMRVRWFAACDHAVAAALAWMRRGLQARSPGESAWMRVHRGRCADARRVLRLPARD